VPGPGPHPPSSEVARRRDEQPGAGLVHTPGHSTATWLGSWYVMCPRGQGAVCKTVHAGSNPAITSTVPASIGGGLMGQPKCTFDCLPRAYERPCGVCPIRRRAQARRRTSSSKPALLNSRYLGAISEGDGAGRPAPTRPRERSNARRCLGQLHSSPSVLSVNTPVGASSWGAMFTAWLSVSIG
jgi:hypothetical protein